MRSLVNAPTVAADLLRMPGGAAAAEVLVAALNAGPVELEALSRAARGQDDAEHLARRNRLRETAFVAGTAPLVGALDRLAAELPATPSRATVDALAVATFTRGADLAALLRDDILAWTRGTDDPSLRLWPEGVEALVDALAVALCAASPSNSAGGSAPTSPGDLGPNAARAAAVLRLADGLHTDRAEQIAAAHRAAPGWALAMHRACWAVYLSGRLRTAAVAQFTLAGSLARRADRVELAGGGAFAALSGALHAAMVADLLDEQSSTRLFAPLEPWLSPDQR